MSALNGDKARFQKNRRRKLRNRERIRTLIAGGETGADGPSPAPRAPSGARQDAGRGARGRS